jgi:hypothetical protein
VKINRNNNILTIECESIEDEQKVDHIIRTLLDSGKRIMSKPRVNTATQVNYFRRKEFT